MTADECEELIEHLLIAEERMFQRLLKGVNKGKLNRRGWRILCQAASEG